MVAYSFKAMFAPRILDGSKRQTIRADRRRHARPGEQLQLYTGMRTKRCRLIARATCLSVSPVSLVFREGEGVALEGFKKTFGDLDAFGRADGFESWAEMKAFWRSTHPGVDVFDGVLIRWGELDA